MAKRIIIGALATIGVVFVLALAKALIESDPDALLNALGLVWRVLLPLAVSGGMFGALLLRKVTFWRVALAAILGIALSAAFVVARIWFESPTPPAFMRTHFKRGTPERELIATLGPPARIQLRSNTPASEWSDCEGGNSTKRLEYVTADGSYSTSFYLDSEGRLLCQRFSIRHL